ncbi:MAG: hypothetical protein OEQ15_03705 [Nitrosopumilus sp.]|nr:hypothetical protein [Nitrosopumilus sp.]MDH3855386.1 hypothetical protein [Nitrosopumilus sp.]
MGQALIYIGIAVGVAAMAGAIIYGTENQKNYVPEDAVLQSQADEGLLQKTGALGADLNKEQWYEDPYAEKAAEIREKFESGQ